MALATLIAAEDGRRLGAKLLVSRDRDALGSLGDPALDAAVKRDALGALSSGRSGLRRYGAHGETRRTEVTLFVSIFAPPPTMIILGAMDFSSALGSIAKVLGYRVVICDARSVFATKARFAFADEIVVEWPDRYLSRVGQDLGGRDAICVLTHDNKFDVAAIVAALETNAGYIGAMGSRTTKERRDRLLADAGVSPGDLDRVLAPIGLDLGARTPAETAVSIIAEIIARQTATSSVVPLSQGKGAIHHAGRLA
ncbi:MAG: XdhC family protein [Acidimicrobiales bacterium]